MAHAGSYYIEWGLSHQMGRQLGPRFGIPHGFTSAILLPAVVEMERPQKVEQEACVAKSLGVASGGAADALRRLVRDLGLPASCRDAGSNRPRGHRLALRRQPGGAGRHRSGLVGRRRRSLQPADTKLKLAQSRCRRR